MSLGFQIVACCFVARYVVATSSEALTHSRVISVIVVATAKKLSRAQLRKQGEQICGCVLLVKAVSLSSAWFDSGI